MKKLSFLLILTLSGCSTVEQKRISDFMNSPAGKAIIHVAVTTGGAAVNSFAASGKVDGKEVAQAALSGASAELRKAQTPGFAAASAKDASAVQAAASDAIHDGAGVAGVSRKVAPAVAQAVADAVKNHAAPADLALEAAARGLDQAAASH